MATSKITNKLFDAFPENFLLFVFVGQERPPILHVCLDQGSTTGIQGSKGLKQTEASIVYAKLVS